MQVLPAPVAEETIVAASDVVTVVQSRFWRNVSAGLAAIWALTTFGWWSARRPARKQRLPEPPPVHKQQSRLLKDARRAARAGDAAGVRSAMLSWGRLQWIAGAPRSVGELATRVSEPLASELHGLCGVSYGPGEASWDGEVLAKALRTVNVLKQEHESRPADTLPPLMPNPPAVP